MSKSVILSLLGRANTGDELLQILDTLTADEGINEPTADPIEFWSVTVRSLVDTRGRLCYDSEYSRDDSVLRGLFISSCGRCVYKNP